MITFIVTWLDRHGEPHTYEATEPDVASVRATFPGAWDDDRCIASIVVDVPRLLAAAVERRTREREAAAYREQWEQDEWEYDENADRVRNIRREFGP